MNKNMAAYKVLFTSAWYPHSKAPREGNFVKRHALAVAEQHEVFAVHAVFENSLPRGVVEVETEACGDYREAIAYFGPSWGGVLTRFATKWKAYRKAFNALGIDKRSLDIIHGNIAYPGGVWAYKMKGFLGVPAVLSEHWTGYHHSDWRGLNALRRAVLTRAARGMDALLPVSQDLAKAMRDKGIEGEYHVVGNVVDTSLFKPLEDAPASSSFLHVSHLGDEHKNIRGMLRAFAKVYQQEKEVHLEVIGDGDPGVLLDEIKRLGLGDAVTFLGEHDAHFIAQRMQRAAAFVLFSRYENLPCVLLEALACGCPVLTTDVGGIREIVHDKNGICMASEDEEALTRAMLQVVQKKVRFMPKQAMHKEVADGFSSEAIANRFTRVYQNVLGR